MPANSYYSIKVKSGFKTNNPDFDVTRGSFGGAEVCELVDLHVPDILIEEFGDNKIRFYRDDRLS